MASKLGAFILLFALYSEAKVVPSGPMHVETIASYTSPSFPLHC